MNVIKKINKSLKNTYPLKISLNKINTLSHFYVNSNNYNKLLSININLQGQILNGEYKNYKIIKVITTKTFTWNKYLYLYTSFLNNSYNPCISLSKFIYLIHTYNYNDLLNIKSLIIKKK